MDHHADGSAKNKRRKLVLYSALILGGLSAPYLSSLWSSHKVHILQFLPYVIFLLCPILHLFLHRGHGKNK